MYQIWRACERLGILPPGIEPKWDDNDEWMQEHILAYCHGREREESDLNKAFLSRPSL